MFTIDASVHVSALNISEPDSVTSQAFVAYVIENAIPVIEPTLLLVEIAAAIARVFNNTVQGVTLAQTIRMLPKHTWVALDDDLTDKALSLAAEHRLRGADAIYAAVAHRHQTILVTLDQQQLSRLPLPFIVRRPADVLQEIQIASPRQKRPTRRRKNPSSGK